MARAVLLALCLCSMSVEMFLVTHNQIVIFVIFNSIMIIIIMV